MELFERLLALRSDVGLIAEEYTHPLSWLAESANRSGIRLLGEGIKAGKENA
jgi:hypothetical protein